MRREVRAQPDSPKEEPEAEASPILSHDSLAPPRPPQFPQKYRSSRTPVGEVMEEDSGSVHWAEGETGELAEMGGYPHSEGAGQ